MFSFQVQGMSCGHCVQTVTKAVQVIDAKAQVQVDLAAGGVRVESSAPKAAIAAAIGEAGYEVLST